MIPRHSKPTWFAAIFIVSLVLNVFMISMLIGKQAGHEGGNRRGNAAPLASFNRSLPANLRPEMRKVTEKYRSPLNEKMKLLQIQRDKLRGMLAKQPLPEKEIRNLLTKMRSTMTDAQEVGHALMLDMAKRLPPDQRSRLMKLERKVP